MDSVVVDGMRAAVEIDSTRATQELAKTQSVLLSPATPRSPGTRLGYLSDVSELLNVSV